MTTAERDRSGVPKHDPWTPQGCVVETERRQGGVLEPSVTVFLTGAECPFQCAFCDLWRFTLEGPTPEGALPAQLDAALEGVATADRVGLLKLYNASNWFDERAVPAADDEAIASRTDRFRRVVVESHARLVGERCRRFAERLDGRLQVALGVETVHPEALARMNKGLDLDDLRQASRRLADWQVELRTFVLVGVPWIPQGEQLDWLERSVEASLAMGAVAVSMIPLRVGETAMRRLMDEGALRRPTLDDIEAAWERCRGLSAAVQLDTWDLDDLIESEDDRERVARLRAEQTAPWTGSRVAGAAR